MNYNPLARVDFLVVHCSATREGQDLNAAWIDRVHRQQGWKSIGYHYVIKLDGAVEKGRPDNQPGAHARDYNNRSLGICYIGGLAADGKTPKDTRTPAQTAAMANLLKRLKAAHPAAHVLGHRDLGAKKACPSFDCPRWWASVA